MLKALGQMTGLEEWRPGPEGWNETQSLAAGPLSQARSTPYFLGCPLCPTSQGLLSSGGWGQVRAPAFLHGEGAQGQAPCGSGRSGNFSSLPTAPAGRCGALPGFESMWFWESSVGQAELTPVWNR